MASSQSVVKVGSLGVVWWGGGAGVTNVAFVQWVLE